MYDALSGNNTDSRPTWRKENIHIHLLLPLNSCLIIVSYHVKTSQK